METMSAFKPSGLWDISENFLGELLAKRFNREAVDVKEICYEKLECIDGFFTQIYRLRLAYFKYEPQLPETLVVKLDQKGPCLGKMTERPHALVDEVHFYSEVAPLTENLKVPHCYYGDYNHTTNSGMLILEDLSHLKGCDDLLGMSLQESAVALCAIARLHARWWNQPEPTTLEWLPDNNYVLADEFCSHWKNFKKNHEFRLSTHQVELGDKLMTKMKSLLLVAKTRPQSIIHGDLRADNLRYLPGKTDSMTFLDWQQTEYAMPAFDFVRLACESRDSSMKDLGILATIWHKALLANGVRRYSYGDCLFDIRLATLIGLHIPVVCHAHFKESQCERGRELVKTMTRRYFTAAERLYAKEVLLRV